MIRALDVEVSAVLLAPSIARRNCESAYRRPFVILGPFRVSFFNFLSGKPIALDNAPENLFQLCSIRGFGEPVGFARLCVPASCLGRVPCGLRSLSYNKVCV